MSIGGFFALYGAGLLTFASPCVLPLVPVYVALLGGTAASGDTPHPGRLRRAGLGFAVGLSAVFVLLGVGASFAAAPLIARGRTLAIVAGVAMIVFGLQLLDLVRLRALQADRRPLLERVPTPGGFGGGVLFGAAFAVGWTPCVGPVLGAALTYAASTSASPWVAGLQLAAYAAGLATPLVGAAVAASKVLPQLRRLARNGARLQRGMGALLVAVGLLFASGRLDVVAPKASAARGDVPRVTPADCAASPSASACGVQVAEGISAGAALTGKPRLVEFVSDHCTVCARMAPVLDDLVRACDASDAVLRVRLEDPSGAGLASRYGVRVVPTLVSVDAAGAEVERRVGEQSRDELSRAIGEVRGRACGG